MQRVISINLNGNAYQLDEGGYEALHAYLMEAERALADNPDRHEIVADLEQAIAEKCHKFLAPHKSVVTAAEIARIVDEMGPIESPPAGTGSIGGAAAEKPRSTAKAAPRRLYRIGAGAMFAGVCNGLAAYFGVDVTVVRIGFAVAAVLTKGVGALVYVVMMFVIPEANTPEERAAATGVPFNAKEVLARAKTQYAEGSRHLRKQWQEQRYWRRYGWSPVASRYAPASPLLAVLPLFALVHLALFVTMAAMMISLVNTGGVLNWRLPENVPLWAAVLILLVGYQIAVSPIRAVHQWSWQPQAPPQARWFAFWHAVVWIVGLAGVLWLASNHVPEIQQFVQQLPQLARDFAFAMRDLFRR